MQYGWFSGGRTSSHPFPPCVWRARPCVCCPFCLSTLIPSPPCRRRGWGPGPGGGEAFCCPAMPQSPNLDALFPSRLPPLSVLQMEPHPEEVPITLGPDLLSVRKSGVSRTRSLPNDSYMCRDGRTAEGSLGHRGWGLPKAQSGTRAGGRLAWFTPGTSSLPKLCPDLGELEIANEGSPASEEPPA